MVTDLNTRGKMLKASSILEEKYEILNEIGRGGMSIVYKGKDKHSNKILAVKVLENHNFISAEMQLERVWWEANIMNKANHPALTKIIDIIEERDRIYLIMEYIQGFTLDCILEEQGSQSQEKAVKWTKQLADVLVCLHSMNPPVIYRDMKPSNIMIQLDGRVKLIDFGAAKEYQVGAITNVIALGTKGYAAPEQYGDVKGYEIYRTDIRTDIYNLGATLYHVIKGKNLAETFGKSYFYHSQLFEPSGNLEKIILKCIKPHPEKRYQSCDELLRELKTCEVIDTKSGS